MQTLSFMIAFGFALVIPSLAGSSDSGVPGVGTFAYSGSSVGGSTPPAIMIAAR